MPQIGLKNLFYAPITEDSDGNETYGTPVRMAKAVTAGLTVNSSDATFWADDGADVTLRDFQSGVLSLGINDLESGVAADLLGAVVDDNGVLVSAGENQPKPVAIGFKSDSAKGGARYFWFYRVTFSDPGADLKTKGESVEFSAPTIEGAISRRNKLDAEGKHPWKAEVKEGNPGVSASVISNWFSSVYETIGVSAPALSNVASDSPSIEIVPEEIGDGNTPLYIVYASGSASASITFTPNANTSAMQLKKGSTSVKTGTTTLTQTFEADGETTGEGTFTLILTGSGGKTKTYTLIAYVAGA